MAGHVALAYPDTVRRTGLRSADKKRASVSQPG